MARPGQAAVTTDWPPVASTSRARSLSCLAHSAYISRSAKCSLCVVTTK